MSHPLKLRWGILGAARVNERLLPAIVESQQAELVAIASRRPGAAAETLAKYAPQLTTVRSHDTPETLLTAPDIDVIYCPLANHEHAEWTLRAIAHGKHVLCEKPLALNVADIDAIQSAARQQGVTVMEGFMYRFHPQHARVLALVQSGLIGEIRSVRSSYSFMMRPARLYRLADNIERGGGAMWDIGCYAIHSARLFFDTDPIAVIAHASYVDSGADITSSGILDFGGGKFAHFDFSFERARRCEYEVIGTKGGLKCHTVWQLPGDVPVISWWTEGGQSCEERLPASNHFNLEIEHFNDCVLNGKPPLLSLEDAKSNCSVIRAALLSAAEGRAIKLT
jgi:D-xylose 1-dehydrogenase (NADP+, D-xylono-1,5-lactone-forming)